MFEPEVESSVMKDKWFQDRLGKFTASKIDVIMHGGTKGAIFGQGALTYIKQKAIEKETFYWENPKLEYVKGFLHGKMYEEPAFNAYVEYTKNTSMRYMGTVDPLFFDYDANSGGSPDGILGEGLVIHGGLELKCPEQSTVHWDYLEFKDQWALKAYNPEYYGQVQFLMMIFKVNTWHWASFDERFKNDKLRLKVLEIKKDNSYCDELDIRISQGAKVREQMIEDQYLLNKISKTKK